MTLKALVLCAGRGTRLEELTQDCPKPLLPIEGKPLVGYTLDLLARHGITDVAVNLHFLADRVETELGNGSRYGLRIHYEREDELLGTAGAAANLLDYFADASDVLVIYGDLVFDEDLTALYELHRANEADATLLVHQRTTPSNSIIDIDGTGRIIRFRERPVSWSTTAPVWVNSGCQILRRELIERFPSKRPLDLPQDIYMPMAADLRLFGVPVQGYRIAVDSPERYHQAIRDVKAGKLRG
ncbi:MAG: nucleotidyltransferase family protein [Myxococcales bacterium]|nr:nucleotidyltransferase family protein [Myxococcales bacterium]MDH3842709.1 nucleotidyltransferase family protein [Myxococcales bacterium]